MAFVKSAVIAFLSMSCICPPVNSQNYPSEAYNPYSPASLSASGSLHVSPNLLLELMRGLPRDPPICTFNCPLGQLATTREGHVPRYNGCGSYGFDASMFVPDALLFTDCCNAHDMCYDTCGSTKFECDFRFQNCLMQRCNSLLIRGNSYPTADWSDYTRQSQRITTCMSTSRLMGSAPVLAGCRAYMEAQQSACTCY